MSFGNSVDWWLSTKTSPLAFRPPQLTAEAEAYLRSPEAAGLDASALCVNLGVNAERVEAWQRWLKLRKIAENNPRPFGHRRYTVDHRGRSKAKPNK